MDGKIFEIKFYYFKKRCSANGNIKLKIKCFQLFKFRRDVTNVNRSIIQNCFFVVRNERERTDDVSNESWFTGRLQTGACVLCYRRELVCCVIDGSLCAVLSGK